MVSFTPGDGLQVHRIRGARTRRLGRPRRFVLKVSWRGAWILTLTSGAGAILWDPAHPARQVVYPRARGVAALSPDGHRLVFAGTQGSLWLGDPRDGIEGRRIKGWRLVIRVRDPTRRLAVHPRGERVAAVRVGTDSVRIWEVRRRRVAWTASAPYARAIAWSPDGRTLAVAAGQTVTVHAARTGAVRATLATQARIWRHGDQGEDTSLAWTRDGKALLAAGACVRAWRARDGATARFCVVTRGRRSGVVFAASDGTLGGAGLDAPLFRRVSGGLSGPFRIWPTSLGSSSFASWLSR